MKRFLPLLILLAAPASQAERDWTTFEDCTLIEDPANDGDSFHVRYKEREYIVRLYFVDCPETDTRYPDRVKEQGDYFGGLSEKETLRVGKKATEFTEKWLKGGSFTMHTRYEDAQGASSKKRYYVWIEKDDKILAEDLVRNGLARLHGMNTDPPGALTERQFEMRLRTIEKETKTKREGGWAFANTQPGLAAATPNPPVEEKTVKLARPTMARRPEPPNGFLQMLNAGQEITVLGVGTGSFLKVKWTKADGTEVEAVVLRSDLGM